MTTDDKFNLGSMSETDLRFWLSKQTLGTEQYIAGEKETLRRIAILEQKMEEAEEPSRKREMIAVGLAIIVLAITIFAIVSAY